MADTIVNKQYYTRIRNTNDKFGADNKYVRGVIMGLMLAICKEGFTNGEYSSRSYTGPLLTDKKTGDCIYQVCTTDERYTEFIKEVEFMYPNLCEFDIFD